MERATILVGGQVQGVGFRSWARSHALALGLVGHALNLPDGQVEVVVQGERAAIDRLVELLEEDPSGTGRPGHVGAVATQWGTARPGVSGFVAK
jgi:acylphosphatase